MASLLNEISASKKSPFEERTQIPNRIASHLPVSLGHHHQLLHSPTYKAVFARSQPCRMTHLFHHPEIVV
jgi:hypothetical protein